MELEAYWRGMQAVLRGAGNSLLLGCNHPIWPSAGFFHGSRSSNDIKRPWDRIKTTAQQNLLGNWQNGRLWWNDPDAIVLTGERPEHECLFHATAIYAMGGMLLSGSARLTRPSAVSDFWSGAAMGNSRVISIPDMPPHSARLLECLDA